MNLLSIFSMSKRLPTTLGGITSGYESVGGNMVNRLSDSMIRLMAALKAHFAYMFLSMAYASCSSSELTAGDLSP